MFAIQQHCKEWWDESWLSCVEQTWPCLHHANMFDYPWTHWISSGSGGLPYPAPELTEKVLWSTVSQPSLALAEDQEVSLQQSGALALVRDAKYQQSSQLLWVVSIFETQVHPGKTLMLRRQDWVSQGNRLSRCIQFVYLGLNLTQNSLWRNKNRTDFQRPVATNMAIPSEIQKCWT